MPGAGDRRLVRGQTPTPPRARLAPAARTRERLYTADPDTSLDAFNLVLASIRHERASHSAHARYACRSHRARAANRARREVCGNGADDDLTVSPTTVLPTPRVCTRRCRRPTPHGEPVDRLAVLQLPADVAPKVRSDVAHAPVYASMYKPGASPPASALGDAGTLFGRPTTTARRW
jgi:hypothetical protein